eukprot:CAMPEP_0201491700 /NCGR_PEP_ID=MMETSP0151_2-20130828/30868_1 /ASSEMBLY_ACC=CAM_ASM_000257 /TAXON_ID=200890 /ORGANISM="Paramoeba atlantica, Strain 621/1 / CCAP 1560/9" /LENGTH=706 /DNA_ID=CAMNT_0047878181 /DNA_START=243 /DNA_END=2363 /DNA_ORIENTATION=-
MAKKREAPPLESILVANRGEIACRVMKTAKRLGIRTIAVYSEADSLAPHVDMADEAVCIGPPASSESYLRVDRILEAIQKTKAKSVHPGYGFLSERASFVQELEENGTIFIGPGSYAMNAMGDKIESKKIASQAKVNVIPGFVGEVNTDEDAIRIAREVGYPVMIKASAGGGGKGLRIAWNDEEVIESYHLSKAEAISSFGDDRMLIEKFVDNPRHIEIQLLMDQFGEGVYLPERECSIQRRNQKVTEEAPSSFIDEETRHAMGRQAVSLAKAVQYKSAGTVEMLVDSQKNFYFLEMNTRLQVEHPITEQITNLDLVEEMIRIAAGEPLRVKQEDVKIDGWAFESRVYAENPLRGFLPSVGLLTHYTAPDAYLSEKPEFQEAKALRIDSGIREGSEISMYYDPMISKLVTWGKDRPEAMERMRKALDCYKIRGLNHNLCFLRAVLDHPRFIEGNYNTKFIDEEYPDGYIQTIPTGKDRSNLLASTAVMQYLRVLRNETVTDQIESFKPTQNLKVVLQIGVDKSNLSDKSQTVSISCDYFDPLSAAGDGECIVDFLDESGDVTESVNVCWDWRDSIIMNTQVSYDNGDEEDVFVHMNEEKSTGFTVAYQGLEYDIRCLTPLQHDLGQHMIPKEAPDLSKFTLSPMPGRVISCFLKPGQTVEEGDKVLILEAMKMQNIIRAEKKGVVKSLGVEEGGQVDTDDVLIEWE